MIPRHNLPFGVGRVLSALVSTLPDTDPSDVEKAYADALGVCSTILLPSVRAGIHMVIKSLNNPDIIVTSPAYTCHTVHEALAQSRTSVRLVDSAPGSFLMSTCDIISAIEPGCALVLSELYGIPYDLEILRSADKKGPSVRIIDMAMCIPSQERMRQLQARDAALFSFGWGKPMYAGWGGIACFQDIELAGRVREIRDRWAAPESFVLRFRRNCSTLFRVAMNQRYIYGLWHERHLYSFCKKNTTSRHELGRATQTLPHEWTHPMTHLNRKLALHNLRHSAQNSELRSSQAEAYSSSLVETGIVRGSGSKALPQSHFPIRVPSAIRDKMCDYLRGRGIDTSTLFPLPAGLSRAHYPHAAEAADEVITLPLGPTITPDEVRMISVCVTDGLRSLGL